jgi:predicted TIM-barrel fold metal-dependent hydrolase
MSKGEIMADKLWANSGDSHFVEPPDLFDKNLPKDLAERMPKSVKDPDGEYETVTVDGQSFRRKMPKGDGQAGRQSLTAEEFLDEKRLQGGDLTRGPAGHGWDVAARLADLDGEGIWGELVFPSLGIWSFNIRDPKLAVAGAQVVNDWAGDIQRQSPRIVPTASLPLIDVHDTIAEVQRATEMGFKAGFLPVRASLDGPGWAHEQWDPLWDAFAETGMVVAFHIGTEPHTPDQRTGVYHTGRGGAVMNYTETTFGGQRAICQMVASGALDQRPNLRVMVSEGGSGWIPFIADRLDEAYRQHSAAVRPRLTRPPGEILYEQVYASFQHDSRSAVLAMTGAGFRNTVWGSDYPHFEGTFGHTQKTLHELFDDAPAEVSRRMRIGAFMELFPHVPAPPPDGEEG